jgi:lysophospholipase L1-like esterase
MAAGGTSGAGATAGASSDPPAVRIVGRTAASTNGVRVAWPGVSFTARFSGTQASIQLNDGGNRNRFTVVVDNGTPTTFTTASGTTKYPLATGLPNGEHQVVVWRNTESYGGVTEFLDISDFGSGGMLLAPPAAPAHRIEVVGDSISCGAGVEGTSTSCTTDNFTNNYLAYGSIAARALGVDLFTIAYSGIGMYRSYTTGGAPPPVMADRYDHAITNDGSAWDFSKYTPDAVVINLGSNDWSAGDPGQPFIDKYVSFIAHVRSKYASAKIVCVIQNSNAATAINSVVTKAKGDGDMNVEAFDIHSYANGNACASHPDKAGQAAMGAALAAHLKSVLGW